MYIPGSSVNAIHTLKANFLILLFKYIIQVNSAGCLPVCQSKCLHISATHLGQQDRHEQLGRWAPLHGRRERRSLAAVCPAPAPGPGALPAAPWSSPPPLPLEEAAAAAEPPPPRSPTGGPSYRETVDGRRVGRQSYEEEERECVEVAGFGFNSWVTFWKWENSEILCGWSSICTQTISAFRLFKINIILSWCRADKRKFKRKSNISIFHFQHVTKLCKAGLDLLYHTRGSY